MLRIFRLFSTCNQMLTCTTYKVSWNDWCLLDFLFNKLYCLKYSLIYGRAERCALPALGIRGRAGKFKNKAIPPSIKYCKWESNFLWLQCSWLKYFFSYTVKYYLSIPKLWLLAAWLTGLIKTKGGRAFAVRAPQLWNELPDSSSYLSIFFEITFVDLFLSKGFPIL